MQDESCIRIMDRRIQIIEIYESEIHSFHVTRSNHIQEKDLFLLSFSTYSLL